MLSIRKAYLQQQIGRVFRRRPRRRELLYFGLGIFLLNLAVSYLYSSKPLNFESSMTYSNENSLSQNEINLGQQEDLFKKQKHDSKDGLVDTMPISVGVKQYKVSKPSKTASFKKKDEKDPIIAIMNSQMVKDLKIEVAISDLEHFVEQKEKEEKEKRRKEGIPEEESTISSQNLDEINEENINRESIDGSSEEFTSYRKIEEEFKSKFEHVQESRLKDIDKMFNPWLSKHSHKSEDEELLEVPSEDFDIKRVTDTGCTIRSFKNATMYSSSEFIHEYINYKKCISDKRGSQIADWQKKIIVKTGSKGQLIVDSTNKYGLNPKDFCSNPTSNSDRSQPVHPKVLYLVLSNHTSIEAAMRESIRSTWSTDVNKTLSDNHVVLFFLGKGGHLKQNVKLNSKLVKREKIIEEGSIYKDIVTTDVDEFDPQYHVKQTFAMLSWMYKYCQLARFVVKTTSNTYVNLNTLEKFADQEMFAANRIYGSILKRRIPDRRPEALHYISEEEWPWGYFPPFLREPSFVVSGDVVPRLLLAASITPQISLDSVYIAGILPALLGLSRIEVNTFFRPDMPKPKSEKLINKKNECAYGKYGMIHEVHKPVFMQQIDDLIHDMRLRNVTCQVAPRCIAKVEGRCVLKSEDDEEESDSNQKGSKKKKKSSFLKTGGKIMASLWGDKTAVFG